MLKRPALTVIIGLLLGATGPAFGQRPYDAVVYEDEARFVFPVPDRPDWICDGERTSLQYGWEVETVAPDGVLRFGFMAWGFRSRPDTLTFSEIVESCGQVGVWRPEGSGWRVITGLRVEAIAIEIAAGGERLVLRVSDPATLRLLFPQAVVHAGTRSVMFTTAGSRLEESAIEVPLFFHRGPAPPLLRINPPAIRQMR